MNKASKCSLALLSLAFVTAIPYVAQADDVNATVTTAENAANNQSSSTSQQSTNLNGWVKGNDNQWTYYNNGSVTAGRSYSYLPTINGSGNNWYLVDNGVAQSRVQQWAGTYYYFNPQTYLRVDNNYVQSQWGNWYMFGPDGRIATKVYQWYGTYYYFDPSTYLRVDNDYRQSQWGLWYMFGHDGKIVTGAYNYAGGLYYFDPTTYLRVDNNYIATQPDGRGYLLDHDGRALTGVQKWYGSYYYFDPHTYLRVDNNYVQSQWGDWYMFGNDGRIVTGFYNWMGSTYYFDPNTYLKLTNTTLYLNGNTYAFNGAGQYVVSPLIERWKSIINQYHTPIAIGIQKQDGEYFTYTNAPGTRFKTASSVKVAILTQLLHVTGGNLNGYQQALARQMIRDSDNTATDTLSNDYLGGDNGCRPLYAALGMNETTVDNHWASTLTTPRDQLLLLNQIFINPHPTYISNQSQNYIKSLMSSVSGDQSWGISAGSNTYYVKNGWRNDYTWHVSSIGYIPNGNNSYTIAVYTTNDPNMNYGVNIIEQLARATRSMM